MEEGKTNTVFKIWIYTTNVIEKCDKYCGKVLFKRFYRIL